MPQMAPLWWTTIYLYTIMAMIMISTMIYFSEKKKKNKLEKYTFKKSLNWKW